MYLRFCKPMVNIQGFQLNLSIFLLFLSDNLISFRLFFTMKYYNPMFLVNLVEITNRGTMGDQVWSIYFDQTITEYVIVWYFIFWCIVVSDVAASFGRLLDFVVFFLWIFIHNWRTFIFEVLYLHQTSTDCVFN